MKQQQQQQQARPATDGRREWERKQAATGRKRPRNVGVILETSPSFTLLFCLLRQCALLLTSRWLSSFVLFFFI